MVKSFSRGLVVWMVAAVCLGNFVGKLRAEDKEKSTPLANASPKTDKAEGKKNKKEAKEHDPNAPSPTPKPKHQKGQIAFPLAPGDSANVLKIPETDLKGQLLSQIMAAKATRIDNEHVQMEGMNIDLYHPDGKEDFHVILPTSMFNLQTRIITSDQPVTVRTQDFELTGERMEFNTEDRTGKLLGKVRMLIHNLKQLADPSELTPKSE